MLRSSSLTRLTPRNQRRRLLLQLRGRVPEPSACDRDAARREQRACNSAPLLRCPVSGCFRQRRELLLQGAQRQSQQLRPGRRFYAL